MHTDIMVLTGIVADRIMFGLVYLAVGALTLWGGFHLADYGQESAFINQYLLRWEVVIRAYQTHQGRWPEFTGNNHVDFMEALTDQMRRHGIEPPDSNMGAVYRYRIERLAGEKEEVFILCLSDRIMLFGLSEKTLNHLDKAVDNLSGLKSGSLIGWPGQNTMTYIGQWRL